MDCSTMLISPPSVYKTSPLSNIAEFLETPVSLGQVAKRFKHKSDSGNSVARFVNFFT